MCRIFVLLLLMLFISPLGAEEIGQIVFPRKAGRIELSLGGGYGLLSAKYTGMSSQDIETYIWGTSNDIYWDAMEGTGSRMIVFEASGNYFFGRHFAIFASLGVSIRKYLYEWNSIYNAEDLVKYTFDVSYLELSLGPKLFVGDFYFGVDGYAALPFANSFELEGSHNGATKKESGSVAADILNIDYGFNFRVGWVKRFTHNFSMDFSMKVQKSMAKLFEDRVSRPMSVIHDGVSVIFLLSCNFVIN